MASHFTAEQIQHRAANARLCFEQYFIDKIRHPPYHFMDIDCFYENHHDEDGDEEEHEDGDEEDTMDLQRWETKIRLGRYTLKTTDRSFGRIVFFGGQVQYAYDIACTLDDIPCVISMMEMEHPWIIPNPSDFLVSVAINSSTLGMYPPIVKSV